jgi:hypothetical protein
MGHSKTNLCTSFCRSQAVLFIQIAMQVGGTTPLTAVSDPLAPLAEGWIYIEKERFDTVPGAYHDRVSGAFVNLEWHVLPGFPPPEADSVSIAAGADSREGIDSGVPFKFVSIPGVRTSNGFQRMPGASCQTIVISYLPNGENGRSLNMAAEVCDELQRKRATDLMLGKGEAATKSIADGDPYESLSRGTVLSQSNGSTWQRVRSSLGPGIDACKVGTHGFSVIYRLERSSGFEGEDMAILVFSREQRLVDKRFGNAYDVLEVCDQ